jgi:hypothetical protein
MGVLSSAGGGVQLLSGGEGWGVNRGDIERGLSTLLRLLPNVARGPPEPDKPLNELRKSGEPFPAAVLPDAPPPPAAGTNSGAWGVTCKIHIKT